MIQSQMDLVQGWINEAEMFLATVCPTEDDNAVLIDAFGSKPEEEERQSYRGPSVIHLGHTFCRKADDDLWACLRCGFMPVDNEVGIITYECKGKEDFNVS